MTSILAWWDPAQNVTTVSGNVSSWVDAANAVTASQGTAGSRPGFSSTAINGSQPGIVIANRTVAYNLGAAALVMDTPMTIIAFANVTTVAASTSSPIVGPNNTNGIVFKVGSDQKLDIDRAGTAQIGLSTDTVSGALAILVGYVDSTSYGFRYNGNASGGSTHAQGNFGTATTCTLFNSLGSGVEIFVGTCGDIIITGVNSATSEIQQAEGYLAWKYSSSSLLPVGHPYKSAPP